MNCTEAISLSKNKILLRICVHPNSSQSLFPAGYNKWRKCIEIKVKAITRDNKANIETVEKIAKYFNIPQKDITIISGHKRREKTISIKNIQKIDVCKKIEESLNGL